MANEWEFIVEDGTGLPNANSYVSVEYYISYCKSRNYVVHHANPEEILLIQQTLVKATEMVDMNWDYLGDPSNPLQALEFPRKRDDIILPVPVAVKKATCLAAVTIPENGNFHTVTDGSITSKSEKVGPIEVTTKYATTHSVTSGTLSAVFNHLRPHTITMSVPGAFTLGQLRVTNG